MEGCHTNNILLGIVSTNAFMGFPGSLILAGARWVPEGSLTLTGINYFDIVSMLSTGNQVFL